MQVYNKALGVDVELDEFDIQAEREHLSIRQSFPWQEGKSSTAKHNTKGSANTVRRSRSSRCLDLTQSRLRVGDIVFNLPS